MEQPKKRQTKATAKVTAASSKIIKEAAEKQSASEAQKNTEETKSGQETEQKLENSGQNVVKRPNRVTGPEVVIPKPLAQPPSKVTTFPNQSMGQLTIEAWGEGLIRIDANGEFTESQNHAILILNNDTSIDIPAVISVCYWADGKAASRAQTLSAVIPAKQKAEPEEKPEGNSNGNAGGGNDPGNGTGNGGGGTGDGSNKLESMSFRNIIGGPLKACVEAQQEAASATFNYMTSTMLEKDTKGIADYKPVMMRFCFIKDGLVQQLEIPLMAILPIPYMNINYVDLDFEAMITYCKQDKNNDDVTLKACYPVSTRLLNPSNSTEITYESHDKEVDAITARENINIRIHATTSDQPAGLSKLIELLDTHMTEFIQIEPPKEMPY